MVVCVTSFIERIKWLFYKYLNYVGGENIKIILYLDGVIYKY